MPKLSIYNLFLLVSILAFASLGEVVSQERRSIEVTSSLGQTIVVSFDSSSNLTLLAHEAVDAGDLDAGEGCRDKECVAAVLENAMRSKLTSDSYSPLDKVKTVYGMHLPLYQKLQSEEDAAKEVVRNRALEEVATTTDDQGISGQKPRAEERLLNNDGVLRGNGVFASVPCIPPFCDFECAAPPMSVEGLERLSSFDPVLGASGWPPLPRMCPVGLHGGNSSSVGQSSGSTAVEPAVLPSIRPLWIGVPAERVVGCVPRKSVPFARAQVTTHHEQYKFGALDEHEYHRSYRLAYFGSTRKKAGWDCMRHYEILAAGSIPWFTDWSRKLNTSVDSPIEHTVPENVMSQLPLRLLAAHQRALHDIVLLPVAPQGVAAPSLPFGAIDFTRFDADAYLELASALLAHTQRRLTTEALARYILETSGHAHLLPENWENEGTRRMQTDGEGAAGNNFGGNGRVLLLSGHGDADYVRDMTLHGFRKILGARLVDSVRPRHLYRLRDYDTLVQHQSSAGVREERTAVTAETEARSKLYGLGFSFAHHLPYDYDYYDDDDDDNKRRVPGDDKVRPRVEARRQAQRRSGSNVIRSEDRLKSSLASREYSLVVYGNVHRGLPLWKEVLAAGYGTAGHLVLLDGEDEQGRWSPTHVELRKTGGHLYVREMPPGCPPTSNGSEHKEGPLNVVDLADI
eukprot:CAMPEP_0171935478 /NCGR_PEP_ID=MMETSP0993-20121228/32950_1 /TAXON_ID=483369 /ORGANISM="non described non described, Strain CCMP2098" /LENGTH=684 /DNA_ID=CAMNT_0012576405 /DNA_START=241 /DNA_END=2295 /DNA_ORIENTATION=+